ncbi:MAG: methyltransferase FkbM [Solirubrobacterales bacterium]|nr:methyltransferase FkbM [Solirubrobacterales bacterium]
MSRLATSLAGAVRAFAVLARLLARWGRDGRYAEPHLGALARELDWSRAHDAAVRAVPALLARDVPLRLELGSSGFARQGWVSVDVDPAAELRLDLRRALPFPDGSVAELHSEHVFEHLAFPAEIGPLLDECLRVLVPGGILSFSVPNVRPHLEAYVRDDTAWLRERVSDRPPGYDGTALDLVAWFALREGDHRTLYDDRNAVLRLVEHGFADVAVREFDPARDYNFRQSSVYVQGVKPRA